MDFLKSSPGNQERSDSGLGCFVFQILDYVLEAHGIARVGFDQRLVGLKDMEPRFLGVLPARARFCEGGGCRIGGFGFDREEVVEAETFEKGEIPGVRTNHAKTPTLGITEVECHCGKSSHERGVHQLAFFEVEDEFGMAFGDHEPGKFLEAMAIFESPATVYFDPDRPVRITDENTRCLTHDLMINSKNTMRAKSNG